MPQVDNSFGCVLKDCDKDLEKRVVELERQMKTLETLLEAMREDLRVFDQLLLMIWED